MDFSTLIIELSTDDDSTARFNLNFNNCDFNFMDNAQLTNIVDNQDISIVLRSEILTNERSLFPIYNYLKAHAATFETEHMKIQIYAETDAEDEIALLETPLQIIYTMYRVEKDSYEKNITLVERLIIDVISSENEV